MSRKEIIENFIKQSKKQLSLKEISEGTGVPNSTVHKIVKELGYQCVRHQAWNKGLTKENNASLKSMSQKKKMDTGWKHDRETREKISNSLKGKMGTTVLGGIGNSYDYGDDIVNSDYELRVAQLLDEEKLSWNNKDSIKIFNDGGITRMIYLGFYLHEYNIYISVKYHISSEYRRRISLVEKQHGVKVLIVDQMLFRRITYNSIKDVLKNSLQNG
ncbi:gp525 [Bacillus phage G]|uniref:Gp525 n=1 Tax=Bacillus phage G TaxID=2884420 RepID=G3MAR6_9CAUD|nr:gp525 [Bacillus phage G]AEO93783.1 gp525 [Bacillus phage G]